jgi:hypothetical protein
MARIKCQLCETSRSKLANRCVIVLFVSYVPQFNLASAAETIVDTVWVPSPKKQREQHNHHFDSTIWNDLTFREDDIIIGTYAKAGTTWMQQINAQLLFDGDPDLEVAPMSPWLDLRAPPKEVKLPLVEAQRSHNHRLLWNHVWSCVRERSACRV